MLYSGSTKSPIVREAVMFDEHDEEYCFQELDDMPRQIIRGFACVILLIIAIAIGAVAALGAEAGDIAISPKQAEEWEREDTANRLRATPEDYRELDRLLAKSFGVAAAAIPSDSLSDLRRLHIDGGIASSEWNTASPLQFVDPSVSFDFNWHVRQTQAGRRFLPSIFLPTYDPTVDDPLKAGCVANVLAKPNAANLKWLSDNNLPLCLRHNNIPDAMVKAGGRYRLPLTEANRLKSALVWRQFNGALDDTPQADPWGPVSNWQNEGTLQGASAYVRALQTYCPNPAFIEFASNNEQVFFDQIWNLCSVGIRNAATNTYPDAKWLPPDKMAAISLRHRDWVSQNPALSPYDYFIVHSQNRGALHLAYFDAFKSQVSEPWKNLRTSAYSAGGDPTYVVPPALLPLIGPSLESAGFDGVGSALYVGNGSIPQDLTDAKQLTYSLSGQALWAYTRSRNPNAFREVWVAIGPDDCLKAALAGKHLPVTPDVYSAAVEWWAWQCRAPSGGMAVVLRHYYDSQTRRLSKFFANFGAQLTTLNRPDMATLTNEDYALAVVTVPDRIMADAIPPFQYGPRDFWLRGTTVPVTYSTGPQQAWFSAVRLDNQILVYGFTPKNLGAATVNVTGIDPVTVDFGGACRGYWLLSPPSGWTVRKL